MKVSKLQIGALTLTPDSRDEVISRVCSSSAGGRVVSVVTPNVFHLYLAEKDPAVASAIQSADISIPDGWPVAYLLSRRYGYANGRITGSDLSVSILEIANQKRKSVQILGGTDDSLAKAIDVVGRTYPDIRLISTPNNPYLPQIPTESSTRELLEALNADPADIVLLCMGAPKSELHLAAIKGEVQSGSVLCVGATVDFLSGSKRRAPVVMQRLKLEWLFRTLQEPRRLSGRYVKGGIAFLSALRHLSSEQGKQGHV